MTSNHEIRYRFSFPDGTQFAYTVVLDPTSFLLLPQNEGDPPDWALLEQNRCPNCSLDAASHLHCPVAVNLADIVRTFGDRSSYEVVRVLVTTPQRSYSKETTLQAGLSSLVGLVMATSGCPVMDLFRPMARFHLPFASVEETEYRTVSMYLVSQYLVRGQGGSADPELEGLKRVCAEAGGVNAAFALRLREAASNDANINSLVYLDCFAKSTPYAVKQGMKDYRCFFEGYLKAGARVD